MLEEEELFSSFCRSIGGEPEVHLTRSCELREMTPELMGKISEFIEANKDKLFRYGISYTFDYPGGYLKYSPEKEVPSRYKYVVFIRRNVDIPYSALLPALPELPKGCVVGERPGGRGFVLCDVKVGEKDNFVKKTEEAMKTMDRALDVIRQLSFRRAGRVTIVE